MGTVTTVGTGPTTNSPEDAVTADADPPTTSRGDAGAVPVDAPATAPATDGPVADPSSATGSGTGRSRWIVGVDDSPSARAAATWAVENARGRTPEIELVRAWQVPTAAGYDPTVILPTTLPRELEEYAAADLGTLAGELEAGPGLGVTTTTVMSGAASALLDAAENAELLVVGSRGRGGFGRLLLGSTSSQVATHATVPTVVVPLETAAETRPQHIVVGVDGSANSLAALDWALRFADPGTRLDVIMVWDLAPLMPGSEQFVCPEESVLGAERLALICARAVERSGRSDLDVRDHHVNDSARRALHDAAERADLLVTGARGHGAIGSAMLGSISTWLLHHLVVPMVVVPHDDDT